MARGWRPREPYWGVLSSPQDFSHSAHGCSRLPPSPQAVATWEALVNNWGCGGCRLNGPVEQELQAALLRNDCGHGRTFCQPALWEDDMDRFSALSVIESH